MKIPVFVDTSEFVAANFDFKGPRLQALLAHAKSGLIVIAMPVITKQEVIARIQTSVSDAKAALRTAQGGARILRGVKDNLSQMLFQDFDKTHYQELLVEVFETYLDEAEAEHIDFSGVDPADIFDLYFSGQAPFGIGKKKAEFPDAFVLKMLTTWTLASGKTVLVASRDGDFKNAVTGRAHLEHSGTLEQLLDRLAEEFNQYGASRAKASLSYARSALEKELQVQFENSGFQIEDQDGDVIGVRMLHLQLEENILEVRDLQNGRGLAVFDLTGTIEFEADLSYADPEATIYDRESDRTYTFNTVRESVVRDTPFNATLQVEFSFQDPSDATHELSWNSQGDFWVDSSYADDRY